MKPFLTFALCLLAVMAHAATPSTKSFRGAGGIVVTSNDVTSIIIIDGSSITSPTGGVSAVTATNIAVYVSTNTIATATSIERQTLQPAPVKTRMVFGIDSLTSGYLIGAANAWPSVLTNLLPANYIFSTNAAVAGRTLEVAAAAYAADYGAYKPAGGTNGIFFLWGGINNVQDNSLFELKSNWSALASLPLADGYQIAAFTLTRNGPGVTNFFLYDQKTDQFNSWLRVQTNWSYLVDVDAAFPTSLENTNIYLSGPHFGVLAQEYIAHLVYEALRAGRNIQAAAPFWVGRPALLNNSTNVFTGELTTPVATIGNVIANNVAAVGVPGSSVTEVSVRPTGSATWGAFTAYNSSNVANSGYVEFESSPSFPTIWLSKIGSGAINNFEIRSDTTTLFKQVAGSTQIGMNKTTPQFQLDIDAVNNDGLRLNALGAESGTPLFWYTATANAGGRNWAIAPYSAVAGDLAIRVSTAKGGNPASAGVTVMEFLSDGKVGVGTLAPSSALDVTGQVRAASAIISNVLDVTQGSATAQIGTLKVMQSAGLNTSYVTNGLFVGPSGVGITNTLFGSASLDFPSTLAGTSSDLPITVTGVVSNNCHVSLCVPWEAASGGGIFTHFESNGVVYVRFSNNQLTLAIDPTPATFSALVFRVQ